MEYQPSDRSPSAESAFSPIDTVDDADVGHDDVHDTAGDDTLVPDDDEMVIVTDETVTVSDDMVIVAPAPTENPTAEGEMAASEIEMALEEIEKELVEVERALERLGDGSYGRCQTCGGTLSDEELESSPLTRYCRAHLPFEGG